MAPTRAHPGPKTGPGERRRRQLGNRRIKARDYSDPPDPTPNTRRRSPDETAKPITTAPVNQTARYTAAAPPTRHPPGTARFGTIHRDGPSSRDRGALWYDLGRELRRQEAAAGKPAEAVGRTGHPEARQTTTARHLRAKVRCGPTTEGDIFYVAITIPTKETLHADYQAHAGLQVRAAHQAHTVPAHTTGTSWDASICCKPPKGIQPHHHVHVDMDHPRQRGTATYLENVCPDLHTGKKKRQLRGQRREEVANKLIEQRKDAVTFRRDEAKRMKKFGGKDLPIVPSAAVLRKAKEQQLLKIHGLQFANPPMNLLHHAKYGKYTGYTQYRFAQI
ncbi:kda protein in nof-fb transposable element [Lasius niger]|uniref:KDa protein in nof-fb transposable element n=1 Tax=Lasius niger TaxID=67767 RepID=A0A0J7KPQ0_LASNI|nr:kda protein in nof-fb transposable element [Lasius niger]